MRSHLIRALLAALVLPLVFVPQAAAAGPRVGVVRSADSAEFGALVGVQVTNRENGWFDVLDSNGYQPEWISGETLDAATLSSFDVVVLPFTLSLSAEPRSDNKPTSLPVCEAAWEIRACKSSAVA